MSSATATGARAGADPIEIYWAPGCTSCLRMKEFIESTGLDYQEHNVVADPAAAQRLAALGLITPATVVGQRGVPGLDLVGIAELIGFDYTPPAMLAPAELKDRYDLINAALCRHISQLTPETIEYRSPDRDRTLRTLAAHAGTIMRRFLDAQEAEEFDNWADPWDQAFSPRPSPDADGAELLDWARGSVRAFDRWWDTAGYDDPLDRVLTTAWGHRTMHEILERVVWHTAQHTRQLGMFLTDLGVTLDGPLTASELSGLPLPARIQA
jgi:glutaredoxin/uncharacterized damage-inducible protein DinB